MSDKQTISDKDVAHVPAEVVKGEVVRAGDTAPAFAEPDNAMIEKYLADMKAAVRDDPEQVYDDIVRRILAAETAEDVLAPSAVEHARDLVNVPLTLHRGKVNVSDFEGGPGVYAVIEAEEIESGRMTTFSCGGRKVLAQLHKLAQLGAFPVDVVIRQPERPTANGYFPLSLEAWGKPDRVAAEMVRAGRESAQALVILGAEAGDDWRDCPITSAPSL